MPLPRTAGRTARLATLLVAAIAAVAASATAAALLLSGVAGAGGGIGTDDGETPRGTTVASDLAAVSKLDPALLAALRSATSVAASDGVRVEINSGWRSAAYQQRLFDAAVAERGSTNAAEQWVARPGTSVHEAGAAVDVGPRAAADWLGDHGAAYGLCRVYGNEPWHFELRPDAVAGGCPTPYADPTHDPRLKR